MSFFDYELSTITHYRSGTIEDPYIPINELKKITNRQILLNEIPVRANGVTISGFVEVKKVPDSGLTANQFVVDYIEAVLTFHESKEGVTLSPTYLGRGNHFVSSRRVWTKREGDNVVETLENLVEKGETALENLEGIEEALEDAQAALNLANQAVQIVTETNTTIQEQEAIRQTNELAREELKDSWVFLENYNPSTNYKENNQVYYNGVTYIAIQDSINKTPDTEPLYWHIFAQSGVKGDKGDQGDTGAQGTQGIKGDKGDKGITWRGHYQSGTLYQIDDAVYYNGSSYRCILGSTGNNPTNPTYWFLIAQKGEDGTGSGTVTSVQSSSDDIVVSDGTTTPDLSISPALKSEWSGKQDSLGFVPENSANKNQAHGYAGLGSDGKILPSQYPDIEEVSWANLTGKPISSVSDIDDAVNNKHTHVNKTTLDGITSAKVTQWDGKQEALSFTPEDVSKKGTANGYAGLDSGAKIPSNLLPDSILGQVKYQGTWNASTNTPALPTASTVQGNYYVISTAGVYSTIDFKVGDWVISNGTEWQKVDNTDAVPTVFGRTGNVVAAAGDYSADKISLSNANFTSTNVNGALTELFQDVSDGKTKIASAITGKGVTTGATATFQTMADNITNNLTLRPGINWTGYTNASTINFWDVCSGNGLYVAVGASSLIMTSSDGANWTQRTISTLPAQGIISSICFGNGLFVAVALFSGTGGVNSIITSPDGISWTIRTGIEGFWYSVCFGNGLFVAVGQGTNNIMTSPDGINWTARGSVANNTWRSVCYGNGLYVAVTGNGGTAANRVMTSGNGITWTLRSSFDLYLYSICYGNGLFVAVGGAGSVMTSTDGINWISRTTPNNNSWNNICFGNGLFVAVGGNTGTENRIMTSIDGVNWISRSSPDNTYQWDGICYSKGTFVSVGYKFNEATANYSCKSMISSLS